MTTPTSTPVSAAHSEALALRFLNGLEGNDPDSVFATLADDVDLIAPFSLDGGPGPSAVFTGKRETTEYITGAFSNFPTMRYTDRILTVSGDGSVVWVQTNGDHIYQGRPYKNVYAYKFEITDGLIYRVYEYANPIIFNSLGIGS